MRFTDGGQLLLHSRRTRVRRLWYLWHRTWKSAALLLLLPAVVASLGVLGQVTDIPPALAQPHILPDQQDVWNTYANGDAVLSLAAEGDTLWVGTEGGGLVRWDTTARRYEQYVYPQSGLPGNDVRAIAVDGAGNKWLSTGQGVVVRSPAGDFIARYDTANSSLPSNDVRSLTIAPDGRVWMATWGGGVAVLSPPSRAWTIYNRGNSGIASDLVYDVAFDSAGRAWLGTWRYSNPTPPPDNLGGGVSIFDGQTWRTYDTANPCLGSNAVLAVARGTGNEMWVGTWAGGISRMQYDGELRGCTLWQAQVTPGLEGDYIYDVAVDTRGRTWAAVAGVGGSVGQGAASYDAGTWTAYKTSNSPLISNNVRAVAADGKGRVWFGSRDTLGGPQGVSVLDGSTWNAYVTAPQGLAGNQITDIAFAPGGQVWIATANNGVSTFNGSTWSSFTRASTGGGLVSDQTQSIAVDQQGRVWIGTQAFAGSGGWVGGGVSMFNPATESWTAYHRDNTGATGLRGNFVQAVAIDSSGRVWVGTGTSRETSADNFGYGLSVFNGSSWRTYTNQNTGGQLTSDRISEIAFDRQGRVWLATQPYLVGGDLVGGGVSVLNLGANGVPDPPGAGDDVWISYTTANSCLPSNDVTSLATGSDGNTWIGTWTHEPKYDWVARQGVHAVVVRMDGGTCTVRTLREDGYSAGLDVDGQNRTWVGTSWGGAHRLTAGVWQSYTTADSPLVSDEIWAVGVAPDGSLWFGTAARGVSHLIPPTPTPTPTATSTPSPTVTPTATPSPTPTSTPVRDRRLYLPLLPQRFTAAAP